MTLQTLLQVLLVVSGYVHGTTTTGRHVDSLISARCAARCLSQLQTHLNHNTVGRVQTSVGLPECLDIQNCSACLKPCNQPFSTTAVCGRLCEEQEVSCRESCHFLNRITITKPGLCPAENDATGFEAACVESCSQDTECEGNLKCCSNGCGHTCRRPLLENQGLPRIPQPPSHKERQKSTAVELEWPPVGLSLNTPILYVIEARWNVGKHFNPHLVVPWQRVAQTGQTSAILRQVLPGRWYQYRVAAVTESGSRGFGQQTKAFTLSKDPQAPGPPRNLTEGSTRIENGKVYLTVHWLPPRKSDLPITRYKLFWSKRLKGVTPGLVNLKEHKKSVSGSLNKYELPQLEPDTTYYVQVMALAHYGGSKLRSERAATYVTTYSLPQATQNASPPVAKNTEAPAPLPVHNVNVGQPFFHNGLLKATVSWTLPIGVVPVHKILLHWTPEACIVDSSYSEDYSQTMSATTHDQSFDIYDLHYDCQYTVKAAPVSDREVVGPVTHTAFRTPSCANVTVRGSTPPDCPLNVPRVPHAPLHLEQNFLISQSNITAVVRWQHAPSDLPLTAYRVTWGQAVNEPHADSKLSIIDKSTAYRKVLSKSSRTLSIDQLREGTRYVVQIRAVSRAGAGAMGSIDFRTPVLQVTPLEMPDRDQDGSIRYEGDDQSTGNTHNHSPKPNVVLELPDKQTQLNNKNNSATAPRIHNFLILLATFSLLIMYNYT